MTPNPGRLTPESIAKGHATRTLSREYKARVQAGEISPAEAIRTCDLPITVRQLLLVIPRWGEARVFSAVQLADLSSDCLTFGPGASKRKGRPLTADERERLATVVAAGATGVSPYASRRPVAQFNRIHQKIIRDRMYAAGCTADQVRKVLAT